QRRAAVLRVRPETRKGYHGPAQSVSGQLFTFAAPCFPGTERYWLALRFEVFAMARLARAAPAVGAARRQRLPRLSKTERTALIEEQAIALLADRGFAVSTRAIATALGISQGLI